MPSEKAHPPSTGGMVREASFRISCEDFNFRMRYSPGTAVADFPSVRMLARAGKMSRDIIGMIEDINPLPLLPPLVKLPEKPREGPNPKPGTELLVAVKSRPVGRISFSGPKVRFVPTPLRFFSKV